jgi:hypothetical protein
MTDRDKRIEAFADELIQRWESKPIKKKKPKATKQQ